MRFNRVEPATVQLLREIVGEKQVIYDDAAQLENYSHDEVAEKAYHHLPEVVVFPDAAEQIAAIMKLANQKMIPVTPRGAGSGLSGGAIPVYGGIVLALDRMNRILEVDKANLMIVVEPGVITNEINNLLKNDGLFYAGYPMSLETCFIGGNVAENAGGGRAIKYGVTDRYVCGLEVVLPTGEIVQFGGKLVKDVTGYNLLHLMVGSEGTLGIFTKIILKLLPLPKYRADLLVSFPDMDTAIAVVPEIIANGKIIPTAIEFMDALSFKASCEYSQEKLSGVDAGAVLLIEVDGNSQEQVETDYFAIGELCDQRGALDVFVADTPPAIEKVWKVRRNIAEAFRLYSPVQSLEDIVVPVAQIPEMVRRIEAISAQTNCPIPCYGHAGDGNLHATPVKHPDLPLAQWPEALEGILHAIYAAVKELGGTISGEHGIGSKRLKYLPTVLSETQLRLIKQVKEAFDPNGILNPGKIVE